MQNVKIVKSQTFKLALKFITFRVEGIKNIEFMPN